MEVNIVNNNQQVLNNQARQNLFASIKDVDFAIKIIKAAGEWVEYAEPFLENAYFPYKSIINLKNLLITTKDSIGLFEFINSAFIVYGDLHVGNFRQIITNTGLYFNWNSYKACKALVEHKIVLINKTFIKNMAVIGGNSFAFVSLNRVRNSFNQAIQGNNIPLNIFLIINNLSKTLIGQISACKALCLITVLPTTMLIISTVLITSEIACKFLSPVAAAA